jgi:hypothetical protein
VAKSKRIPLNRLVLPGTFETVKLLADQLECSEGEVVDRAVEALAVVQSFGVEALRPSQPEAQETAGPATIPGIRKGLPPRESGAERAARERRERQDRARNLDSTDDESFDRSDEYVSN